MLLTDQVKFVCVAALNSVPEPVKYKSLNINVLTFELDKLNAPTEIEAPETIPAIKVNALRQANKSLKTKLALIELKVILAL